MAKEAAKEGEMERMQGRHVCKKVYVSLNLIYLYITKSHPLVIMAHDEMGLNHRDDTSVPGRPPQYNFTQFLTVALFIFLKIKKEVM